MKILTLPKEQIDSLIREALSLPFNELTIANLRKIIKDNHLTKEQAKEVVRKERIRGVHLTLLIAQAEATPERKVSIAKVYRQVLDRPLI